MKETLSELAASFSVEGERSVSASNLVRVLERLILTLNTIPAKFVDIDTSYKEVDQDDFADFKESILIFKNEELESDLCEIYEALNLYLIIQDRFGEAADWNLKVECEGRLAPVIQRALKALQQS